MNTESIPSEGARKIPALYANAMEVTVSGAFTRITFGERTGQSATAHMHSAVVIPTDSAEPFTRLIMDVVARNRAIVAEEKKS